METIISLLVSLIVGAFSFLDSLSSFQWAVIAGVIFVVHAETRMDGIKASAQELEEKIAKGTEELKGRINELETAVNEFNEKSVEMDALNETVHDLGEKLKQIDERLEELDERS